MTNAEINAEVFRRLEELSTDPAFWTVAEVAEALDEAWDDLALRTLWHKNVIQMPLQDEVTYYNLQDFPEEVIFVEDTWNDTTSEWMERTSPKVLEATSYYRWESVESQPDRWFSRGAFMLGVFGKPTVADSAAASDFLVLHIRTVPLPLSQHAPDYNLPFPEEFQYALVDGAISDLKAQEGEVDLALKYWQMYADGVLRFREWVKGHSEGAVVRYFRE